MDNDNRRIQILEMIESGQISTAEGLRRLSELEEQGGVAGQLAEQVPEPLPPPGSTFETTEPGGDQFVSGASHRPTPSALPPAAAKWRRWWQVPLWIGVGVTVFGGLLLYWVLQAAGVGFWFFCSSLPLLLGVAILVLAWGARTSPWLHLRIQQQPGEWPRQIAISLPLPLGLTSWFLRNFGERIPDIQGQRMGEIISAVRNSASPENPLYIEVDEGEGGEKVQIYIG